MRREIATLLSASFIYNFGAGLFGPIYAIFVEQIGGDIITVGSAWAVYCISVGIAAFIFSRFEDRLPKEKIIALGYALLSMGFIGYYFVNAPIHLFAVQMYMGLSMAFLNPAWDAYFTIKADKKKEAPEWGDWEAGIFIVTGVSAVIGSHIANTFGFKTLFLIMFCICISSSVVAHMLVKK